MRVFLLIVSGSFLSYGLWAHDWQVIVGACALAIVVPLIDLDAPRRRYLDKLWDDDDLSDSA